MKKGFTLIELAIVMVVIGLLIGGGFQTMQIMSRRAKVIETQQQLEALREAIKGFVQVNGGLPTQAEFDTLTGTTLDSWNGVINYFHDAALEGTGTLCTTTVTDLSINGDFNSLDVAFVLVSQGENYNLQTRQIAGAPDTVALYNPSTQIDGQPVPTNRATDDFDDISVQMSLAELRAQIGCQPLRIIPTSLPQADDNSTYNIDINASGGGGSNTYSWCWTIAPTNNFSAICSGNLNPSTDNCVANGWRACPGLNISKPINTGTTGTMSNLTIYTRDPNGNNDNHSYSIPMN